MSHKKINIVSTCSYCLEEDIVDVYTKLCKKCQGNDVSIEDDDSEEEDW